MFRLLFDRSMTHVTVPASITWSIVCGFGSVLLIYGQKLLANGMYPRSVP